MGDELQPVHVEAARSARAANPLVHGLTAKQIHAAETEAFESVHASLSEQHEPEGPHEEALCERIALLIVRLGRAGRLERSLYASCYMDDGTFSQLAFDRLVATIGRYDNSLARSLAKTSHELERLQAKRTGAPHEAATVVDFNW